MVRSGAGTPQVPCPVSEVVPVPRRCPVSEVVQKSAWVLGSAFPQGASLGYFLFAPPCPIEKVTLCVGSLYLTSGSETAEGCRERQTFARTRNWLSNDHGYDRSVGKWMYLTVCPLCGPGHDSSVGEWMYLTVCPLHGPGHYSSVGKWMNPTVDVLRGPGSIPGRGEVFQGIFFWLIALCQPILSQRDRKSLNLPSMSPHKLWTSRRKAYIRGRKMAER